MSTALRPPALGPDPRLTVCVIGLVSRREFQPVVSALTGRISVDVRGRFRTIEEACDEPERLEAADVVIVLQSWPDQYVQKSIYSLIGATFGKHVLCLYGPWCESDGRNRALWPDALRVPVREAESVLEMTERKIRHGEAPVPPTASLDEIFADRVPMTGAAVSLTHVNAAVVSPDPSLRRTTATLLKSLGLPTAVRGLVSHSGRGPLRPMVTPRGPIHFVLHDIDPYGDEVQKSLESARAVFPDAVLTGMANLPDAGLQSEIEDEGLARIFSKLSLLADLQSWLTVQFSMDTEPGQPDQMNTKP